MLLAGLKGELQLEGLKSFNNMKYLKRHKGCVQVEVSETSQDFIALLRGVN